MTTQTATIRVPMRTTLGCHQLPARLVLRGRALGLDVTHDVAGGWFEKDHLIVATGDDEPARQFLAAVRALELGSRMTAASRTITDSPSDERIERAPLFGFCEFCGSPRASAIVRTPGGLRDHAVGLQCSADPAHGPDLP